MIKIEWGKFWPVKEEPSKLPNIISESDNLFNVEVNSENRGVRMRISLCVEYSTWYCMYSFN